MQKRQARAEPVFARVDGVRRKKQRGARKEEEIDYEPRLKLLVVVPSRSNPSPALSEEEEARAA